MKESQVKTSAIRGNRKRRGARRSAKLVIGKITFVESALAEELIVRDILALQLHHTFLRLIGRSTAMRPRRSRSKSVSDPL